MNNTDTYKTFCIGIEYSNNQREFIQFGPNTPVKDIMTVMDEEVDGCEITSRIIGMAFLSNKTKDGLRKMYSDWKKHFDIVPGIKQKSLIRGKK